MRHRTVQKAVQPAAWTWLSFARRRATPEPFRPSRRAPGLAESYREPGRLGRGPSRAVPEKKIIVFSPSDDSIVALTPTGPQVAPGRSSLITSCTDPAHTT